MRAEFKHFHGLTILLLLALWPASPASAEMRTPPEATAHALDELANCYAQHRPECPKPTLRPSPTATTASTPTAAPSNTPEPTDEPTATPSPTETPCWLIDQEFGDPDAGYVVFDEATGSPVPCPTETPIADATDEPTSTPMTTATLPVWTTTPVPPAPAPPAQIERVVELQTVVVVVTTTPQPTQQLVSTATPTSTRTPGPGRTSTSTVTSTATRTASPTVTPPSLASINNVNGPLAKPTSATKPPSIATQGGRWEWGDFLKGLAAIALGVVVIGVLVSRRRVATWKGVR